MIYTKKYQARIGDFDSNGNFSLRSILELLEDISSNHSNYANDNIMEGISKGFAWILTEWNVKIKQQPKLDEELTLKTWTISNGTTSFSLREFEIVDSDGNVIIYATSHFVLVDTVLGKIVRITPQLIENYRPESQNKYDFSKSKLLECEQYYNEKNISIRKADIDFNGHVHNTIYMDFAQEVMESKIESIKGFRIVYKSPIMKDEIVTIKQNKTENENIAIYHQNGKLATIIEIYQ